MESVAETVVGYGVNKLEALLVSQFKAVAGVKAQLTKWRSLLTTIQSVAKDAESRPYLDPPTTDWLQKLSDLAAEVEDVEDTFDSAAASARERSGVRLCFMEVRDFFSRNNQILFLLKLSSKIEAVTTKLELLLVEKSLLLNSTHPTGTSETQSRRFNLRETTSENSSGGIVGREQEKNDIISMLKCNSEATGDAVVPVIAIVGIGGLGKTALAQHVFNDGEVKDHFALTMWKVVGCDFDAAKLTKSILELVTNTEINISEPELVRRRLQQALSGKKFLLVLDDMWIENPIEWEKLKGVLETGARGSRVIVTTRSSLVASTVGSSNPLHLQPLSGDECLSLFLRSAFGAGEGCERWVETAEEIVKKCRGVPLAAVALGSLLRTNRDEEYWSSISRSETFEIPEVEKMIIGALRLSYDYLSSQSKQCFAFCSLFPKNCAIERELLVRLWLANGFISSLRKFSAESIGNSVFDELIHRSFFQELKKDVDGQVTKCKMHDLIHDLAQLVAKDRCRIVRYDNDVQDIKERTRHLFIDGTMSSSSISKALRKPQSLRTVMLLPREEIADARLLRCVFSRSKLLRALHLSSADIKKVPSSIGNMIHLRYLDLSRASIEVLPRSIGHLQNLVHLILRQSALRELPKTLRRMQSLRNLDISGCRFLTHMPPGFSQLTSLKRLSNFVVGRIGTGCSIAEIKDLDLQGELSIEFQENVNSDSWNKQEILKNKKDLRSLRINWMNAIDSSDPGVESLLDDLCPNKKLKRLNISGYRGPKFPAWLAASRISNLVQVRLINCKSCEHIPPFGNLRFLTELQIFGMEGVKSIDAEFYGNDNGDVMGFPSLKELSFFNLPKLERLSGGEGVEVFTCLESLAIGACPALMTMPRFPRIQRLDMLDCNGSLLSSQNVGSFTSLSSLVVAKIQGMASLPSGSFQNLASLRKLNITDCTELQSLSMEEVQHLTALEHLAIFGCKDLASLPSSLHHLCALQTLQLRSCAGLRTLPSGLLALSSLKSLKILDCRSVSFSAQVIVDISNSERLEFNVQVCCRKVDLSRRLQHLKKLLELRIYGTHSMRPSSEHLVAAKTLSVCCCDEYLGALMEGSPSESAVEDLTIEDCSSLSALPEWVAEMRSLRYLSIQNCPEMASLPMGLRNLRSLRGFWTCGCGELKRRYTRDGADWQMISHVEEVKIE